MAQYSTPGSFFTGELPVQVFGSNFGGQDAFDLELSYATNGPLWSGCIDAPQFIPSGSHVGRAVAGEYLVCPTSSAR